MPITHPETGALARALAHADLVAPHTGQPLSEALLLGIGGGLGAAYMVFRYEGQPPTLFLGARHRFEANHLWMRETCERLGVAVEIHETGGVKKAADDLRAVLDSGRPAIAWCDLAVLDWTALPQRMEGGSYHVVLVRALDADRGSARLHGYPDDPYDVPEQVLAAARARIKKDKHRLLAVTDASGADVRAAVRAGLDVARTALTEANKKAFQVHAWKKWAKNAASTAKTKDAWPTVFPPGRDLLDGLASAYVYIRHYGTDGRLLRGLYADFLREAAQLLDEPALLEAAAAFDRAAALWAELAEVLLPREGLLGEIRDCLDRYAELAKAQGPAARPELVATLRRFFGLRDFTAINPPEGGAIYDALSAKVSEVYEAELAALALL